MPLVRGLVRIGVGPNAITITGFLGAIATAVLVVAGHWLIAGIVFIVASLMDMFDGSVARLSGKSTPFGAFLDSTLDRFSEGVVLGGIGVAFAREGQWWPVAATFLALTVSFLVSYTRARAEGLGITSNTGGLMSRTERLVVTAAILVFGQIEHVAATLMYVLAGLTLMTVIQRMYHVWAHLRATS